MGKGAEWHNTQFCALRSTRATRQGRWKPITNARKNSTVKQPYNTTIYNTALYMRLSRDDELQGESGSIQTQRMMLRQYAAEHGLNVIDEYIDDGWSGTNFDRPDFQRMIDDIEDGKINCVVTKDYCAIIGLNQKDLENQGILA